MHITGLSYPVHPLGPHLPWASVPVTWVWPNWIHCRCVILFQLPVINFIHSTSLFFWLLTSLGEVVQILLQLLMFLSSLPLHDLQQVLHYSHFVVFSPLTGKSFMCSIRSHFNCWPCFDLYTLDCYLWSFLPPCPLVLTQWFTQPNLYVVHTLSLA